jgi:hypothetical protein
MTRDEAAARRAALREACAICDEVAALVKKQNPGRRKDSVSKEAQFVVDMVVQCADKINALRDATKVPAIENGPTCEGEITSGRLRGLCNDELRALEQAAKRYHLKSILDRYRESKDSEECRRLGDEIGSLIFG